jgi:hypothetical protein
MSTLKADIVTASSTNGNLAISNQGTGGIAIDGMPHRNLIINGDMRIDARGGSYTGLTANQYTLDRWRWNDSGTTAVVVDITQDTDVPTVAEAGSKFMNSLKIDVTTAEDLGNANAKLELFQAIEAQNCTHIGHGATGALACTLQFWIKSTKTGIFCTEINRHDATEGYVSEHTINTTNTWEKKTVTIPGDTSGTAIADDNGKGLVVYFRLAIGSDGTTATADVWAASGSTELATSNQVNLLDNTANNLFLTGVQLEVGPAATDFEYRDYASELVRCHRYYQQIDVAANGILPNSVGYMESTSVWRIFYGYIFGEMRAAATIDTSNDAHWAVTNGGANVALNATTLAIGSADTFGGNVTATASSSSFTQDEAAGLKSNNNAANFKLDAEL